MVTDNLMLHEALTTGNKFLDGDNYYQENIPACLAGNLNPQHTLRAYQKEALGRFKYYLENYKDVNKPISVLYHMATGSCKTLIMASLMLYLYQRGYRNFLFFVNSTNIINKTRDNFLNSISSKYLFSPSIKLNGQQIQIKAVDNFAASNDKNINIFFTTIQGLYSRLNNPRENSVTYDDFESEKIVLISDEAHHINAETKQSNKNLNQQELFESSTWESTVNKIFNANHHNILLEFTATCDLQDQQILDKYRDKIIYDYPLKQFRLDGYSKEVKVLESDSVPISRSLQAIILSQYRRKVFAEYDCLIKPVILFKAKTIKESHAFYAEFIEKVEGLTADDLMQIKDNPNLDQVLENAFKYFAKSKISLENLALELRQEFSEPKCISVNSKEESIEKQLAVNSLEDRNNEYRAIFAVDKLNEGWDVLNLFDIVRLYNTRDAKKNKPGKTTMSEAQLIGRGARYCPFKITDEQPLYQRKYDSHDTKAEHVLKICEELYYHSAYNPKYIQELNVELEKIGIKAKKSRELTLQVKASFKQQSFYKKGLIFKNKREKYSREDITGINSTFIATTHQIKLLTGSSISSYAFDYKAKAQSGKQQQDYLLNDFGMPVIKKALSQFPEYNFDNLKRLFPHLRSISEFIASDNYLGKIKLEIEGLPEQITDLSQEDKLFVAINLLEKLLRQLQTESTEYKGSKIFTPSMIKDTFTDKTLNIANDGTSDKEHGIAQSESNNTSLQLDLSNQDWFVFNENYGTSEEKYFVKYIHKVVDKLRQKYSQVYLIRNEKHFSLYNFDDGKAFEPDFVLFLVTNNQEKNFQYQVFIEPKGSHLIKHDAWKNDFLMRLKAEHRIEQLWKDNKYIVWGMPFYNEAQTKGAFDAEFNQLYEANA